MLVMELLTGGDLCSFLRHSEERLPEARAREIIEDVCAGMAFLHHKNAVHGDLKSTNILLDGEGRVKVIPRVHPTECCSFPVGSIVHGVSVRGREEDRW